MYSSQTQAQRNKPGDGDSLQIVVTFLGTKHTCWKPLIMYFDLHELYHKVRSISFHQLHVPYKN